MLGIAIDPRKDILGFESLKVNLHYPSSIENLNYDLNFFPPSIDGWFPCEQIFATFKNESERVYLDDLAFMWIKGHLKFSEFTIKTFENKDLLEQLCISFLIKRLQREYGQPTETNKPEGYLAKYLKNREEENKFILDRFLEILFPQTELFSSKFSNKYNVEYHEVLEKSLTFVSLVITGELRKIIDEQIEIYRKNPNNKKLLRSYNRSYRITPWETFDKNHPFYPKDGNNRRTDIKNIADTCLMVFIESLAIMSKKGHPYDMLIASMLDVFSKDKNLSQLINMTINCNSERIYKPNSKYSLLSFIFGHSKGKPSRIASYLKDITLRKNSDVQFGQYDPDEISNQELYYPPSCKKRYWKKHSGWQDVAKEKKEEILNKLTFLSAKQYESVKKYMLGYETLNITERKNLERARKKIRSAHINTVI